MPFSETLAQRVRDSLCPFVSVEEKKMFGGIALMVEGNMTVGVKHENLIVRVGLKNYESALKKPGAELFQPTGKPMAGWITVTPEGYRTNEDMKSWITLALDFVRTLPAK